MPVSKNKRKSRKGQNRKESRAKEANNLGGSGFGDQGGSPVFNDTFPFEPRPGIPGVRTVGMSMGGGNRYKVTSPPDNPTLSAMEQIDAIIERSVTFEMTEAHHDNIGLREMDLDGEMSGDDILGPMVARVEVDPLSTIEEHPKWKTGQELIDYLDSDPNVFREEFDGNRWQGLGIPWMECPPSIKECFDRLGINDCGNAPHCPQCDAEVNPAETHFHILYENQVLRLCERCWAKGPLPNADRTLELEFQGTAGMT